jgi:uncharacterized protein (TIGR02996 family)
MTDAPYDHPDAGKFLARVLADPAEDAHRLVFADWLDEHGDPARAELIRLQCAADDPADPGATSRRLGRAAALIVGHGRRWASPLAPQHVAFRRGFVADLYVAASTWYAYFPDWFRRHPVDRVEVFMWEPRQPHGPLRPCHWLPGGAWIGYPPAPTYRLPDDLFDHLWRAVPSARLCALSDARSLIFADRAAALRAVSAALVGLGRQAAGLPPLDPAMCLV